MDFIFNLLVEAVQQVWITFTHNWPFLLVSVLIAVGLKFYLSPEKISAFLTRSRRAGVVGATIAAVATPLCSCGTTAVILGMMASTIPWAPIIAFMVASPLTSPQELIYSAGLFGWPFALAFFCASIALGLLGGLLGEWMEKRGWLANQARFAPSATTVHQAAVAMANPVRIPARAQRIFRPLPGRFSTEAAATGITQSVATLTSSAACTSCAPALPEPAPARPAASGSCGCSTIPAASGTAASPANNSSARPRVPLRVLATEILHTGRRLLVMFLGFAFIGYFLNGLIPTSWVALIFGKGNLFSVPLAATLGLPLYLNTEGSLPLVRALIDGGMSQGAALAFLITGAGTSVGAMTGALTIARWRIIAIVVATLWVGAVITGGLYDLLLAMQLF